MIILMTMSQVILEKKMIKTMNPNHSGRCMNLNNEEGTIPVGQPRSNDNIVLGSHFIAKEKGKGHLNQRNMFPARKRSNHKK